MTTTPTTTSPDAGNAGSATLMEGLQALAPETPQPPPAPAVEAPAALPAPRVTDARGEVDEAKLDKVMEDWKEQATTAEMEVYRPQLMPSPSMWSMIRAMSEDLANAVSVQPALRKKPADIALLLLVGRDVGVKPSVALNKIHVIDGKPSMSSELMRALIVDRGHDIWFDEVTPTSVTICGHRSTWPAERVTRVTWTLEMAKDAELLTAYDAQTGKVTAGKQNWLHYPRSMLKARATSELGRDDFPDVLLGVSYTPEELGADVDESGEPLKIQSTAWNENAQGAPTYQPAPQIVIDAFQGEIDAMDEPVRAVLHAKWKELKLGRLQPVGPDSKIPEGSWMRLMLAVDEIDLAATAIAQAQREAAEDAVTVGEPQTAEGTGPAVAAQEGSPAEAPEADLEKAARAAATVADLTPSQVMEALGRLAIPIESADDATDEERREILVEVIVGRVECPACGALVSGDPMKGEALCGGHEEES